MPRSFLLILLLAALLIPIVGCQAGSNTQRATPLEEQVSILSVHNRRLIETPDGTIVDYYISGLNASQAAEILVSDLRAKGLSWSKRNATTDGSILLVPGSTRRQGSPDYINVKSGRPRGKDDSTSGGAATGCTIEYIY